MAVTAAAAEERTRNPLRPAKLDEIVGQDRAKLLMETAINAAYRDKQPLGHTLIVAPSGTGKSTFSHVIANELGVDVYELEAPVSRDTLLELRLQMYEGDILKVEEIHQQGIMERRGRESATQPEILYSIMEDRTMPTPNGVLPYPRITVIGTTTDEGLLPDAFINRFPLRPRLDPYSFEQLVTIAYVNARTLGGSITAEAAEILARASRGVPRHINNFVTNAVMFNPQIDGEVAHQALEVNGITRDGLTPDMQAMLKFLYSRARHVRGDGEVKYQASVNTIATAIGKSRDSKAVALRVEPFLIEKGYVQVGHGGRLLTQAGQQRAVELLEQEVGNA